MRLYKVIRESLTYFRGRKKRLAVYAVLNLLEVLLSIGVTYSFSRIASLLGEISVEQMTATAGLLAGVYVVTLLLSFFEFHIKEHLEKDVRVDTKQRLLEKIVSSHPSRLRAFDSAKMTEILYVDVNTITSLIFSLIGFLTTIAYILISGVVLFYIDPIIAAGLTLFLVFWSFYVARYSQKLRAMHVELRTENDKHFKLIRDVLKNARYIYDSDASDYHASRYHTSIERVKELSIRADVKNWMLNLYNTILQYAWIIFFLIWGGRQLADGKLTVTAAVFFLLYSQRYSQSILSVLGSYAGLQQTVVSIDRVTALTESFIQDNAQEGSLELPSKLDSVELRDLSYSYPESEIETIHALSQKLPAGLVLLVGKNGSGKTTLLNLISGHLYPTGGEVLLNGIPLRDFTGDSLRKGTAYLTQDSLLFDMTIRENLLSFSSAEQITEERLWEICGLVGIAEDIRSLPKGFDSMVSELRDFSVGQKKKLLLARTFLKPSVLVLLDEPLSGVDVASQRLITEYIAELATQKPVFVSTHKPDQFHSPHETMSL